MFNSKNSEKRPHRQLKNKGLKGRDRSAVNSLLSASLSLSLLPMPPAVQGPSTPPPPLLLEPHRLKQLVWRLLA